MEGEWLGVTRRLGALPPLCVHARGLMARHRVSPLCRVEQPPQNLSILERERHEYRTNGTKWAARQAQLAPLAQGSCGLGVLTSRLNSALLVPKLTSNPTA